METIIDKLKKIKELAERGVEGEKKTAQMKLDKLMKQYDISLEMLGSDQKKARFFSYKNKAERRLLIQIASMNCDFETYKLNSRLRKITIDMTESEYAETCNMIDFYKVQLRKELKKNDEIVYTAFIHKHRLFPARDNDDKDQHESKLSFEEIQAIVSAMQGMDNCHYRKALVA